MKKIILILILVLISTLVYPQSPRDIVYLKKGSVIKGHITEMIPDDHIKIETAGGSIFVYTFAEIEKVEKEKPEISTQIQTNTNEATGNYLSDYYSQSSYGLAIGGGGILGVTYRYFLNENTGLEVGAFYRPVLYEDYYGDYQTSSSVMIAAGPVYYFKANTNWKGKIKKNGISFKVGLSPLSDLNEFMGAVNWVLDTYRPENTDRYFSFELGAGALYRYNLPHDVVDGVSSTMPLIYWKLNWFFNIN